MLPAIIAPAAAGIAKLGIGAKFASAIGAAKGLLGAKAATQLAIPGLATASKGAVGGLGSRMAATTFMKNASALMPKTAAEWGMRAVPDAIFGTLAGAMTPGDLGDKMIAGTAATAGGVLGGLGLRAAVGGVAPGVMKNAVADITSEMVGGIGGDMMAQGVADGILRVKGRGTTPYEKMAADQQRELEQRLLQQYLSGKGGYPMNNGIA